MKSKGIIIFLAFWYIAVISLFSFKNKLINTNHFTVNTASSYKHTVDYDSFPIKKIKTADVVKKGYVDGKYYTTPNSYIVIGNIMELILRDNVKEVLDHKPECITDNGSEMYYNLTYMDKPIWVLYK